ncbi:MAG: hypothetical protein FWC26_06050 [Fibromonadales bacterium]|nr:hypothetical protein [Fibromonadales bacterium]
MLHILKHSHNFFFLPFKILFVLFTLLFLNCEEYNRKYFERFATNVTFRNTECNELSGCKYGSYDEDKPFKGMGRRPNYPPYMRTTLNSITKTKTGAFATHALNDKYGQSEFVEAELSMEEWMNFIRDLYKCCVIRWEKDTVEWEKIYEERERKIKRWELNVYYSDELAYEFEGSGEYPPNWNEFMKIMNDMEKKVKSKADSR